MFLHLQNQDNDTDLLKLYWLKSAKAELGVLQQPFANVTSQFHVAYLLFSLFLKRLAGSKPLSFQKGKKEGTDI